MSFFKLPNGHFLSELSQSGKTQPCLAQYVCPEMWTSCLFPIKKREAKGRQLGNSGIEFRLGWNLGSNFFQCIQINFSQTLKQLLPPDTFNTVNYNCKDNTTEYSYFFVEQFWQTIKSAGEGDLGFASVL